MNPADMMHIAGAISGFKNSHPKFAQFLKKITADGLEEGAVIEVTLTKPDGTSVTGNMRINKNDLELIESLKSMRP